MILENNGDFNKSVGKTSVWPGPDRPAFRSTETKEKERNQSR